MERKFTGINPMSLQLRVPYLVLIVFMTDLVLGIAYLGDYLAGRPYYRLTVFLNLDEEGNLPTWFASMQWFCVALLMLVYAVSKFSRSQKKSWLLLLLPLIFLALSLDEVAGIHEKLGTFSDRLLPAGSRLHTPFKITGIWMVLLGVPFVALLASLTLSIREYIQEAPGAFFKIILGMLVMLTGAMGIETLSNFTDPGSGTWYDISEVLVEEMCELLGATIVLWGSLELLIQQGFELRINRPGGDKAHSKSLAGRQ
jgi:hypothetical protein